MAVIDKILYLSNGVTKVLSLSSDTLNVGALQIGGVALSGTTGATLIGSATLTNFSGSTVAAVLSSIDSNAIVKNGATAFTADQSMGSFKLTNVANGTANTDAVNKGQLDTATSAVSKVKISATDTTEAFLDASITAGAALSKSITNAGFDEVLDLAVNVDNATIEVATDALQVKDAGITNAKIATGIDATKLADGTVTNAELQFINSLTSNAQDQIDSKAATSVVTEIDANVDDLITLSGVAENSANLGIFTGTTIADASTVKVALQSLETSVETKAASSVVTEIDANVDDLITLSGVAENATSLGIFTGTTITDASTVKAALQELETSVETKAASSVVTEIDANVNDLITLSGVAENATDLGTFTGTTIADASTTKVALQALETAVETKQSTSEKGAANGYASLDGSGKVPVAQLPNAIMEYQGMWDASTNTPTLANGAGNADTAIGDVYKVSVAGTVDFGAGSIIFAVGDYAILNSSKIFEKADTSDAVTSIFSRTGAVTAQNGDYTASQITNVAAGGIAAITVQAAIDELDTEKFNSADFNGSFDTRLALKSTTDLAEGTNLYYTDERAQDSIGTILTDTATVDFVYDDATPTITANVLAAPKLAQTLVAGEAFAANTTFLVRFALTGETAGRVYKADADSTTSNKFYAFGIMVSTSALIAADPVSVTILGTHTLGSSDVAFNAADIGLPVFLSGTGSFSITAPSTANHAIFRVGVVQSTTQIFVKDSQLIAIN